MKISKRKKPHDLDSLPAWARALIGHLKNPIGTIYGRNCYACGFPKEEGLVCSHCEQDDEFMLPLEKRAVSFYE